MKIIEGQNNKCQFRFKIGFQHFKGQAPYFSITGDTWGLNKEKIDRNSLGCGALKIGDYIPELAHLDKYHLCSTEGPLHYIVNSLYHAGDKDCHGLKKGEKRQIRDGKTKELCWERVVVDKEGNEIEIYNMQKYKDSNTQPENEGLTIEWRPWCRIGEGKEPDLLSARASAIWPDAKLEDFTEEKLKARLPKLMEQFKKDVTEAGVEFPESL